MIYLIFFIALALIIIIISKKVNIKSNNEKFAINDAVLNHEELMLHGIVAAKSHVISKKRKKYNFLFSRLHENYKFILSVYKGLNEDANAGISLCPASEWLLDNFYIIEEQYKDLKLNIGGESFKELDVIAKGPLKDYPRVFAAVLELISHTDGRMDKNQFINFIDSYQSINLLSIAEIWSLSTMIRLSIIEKIRYICEKIQITQIEWEKIDTLKELSPEEIAESCISYINDMTLINSSYIEHLLNTLKREEFNCEAILNCITNKLIEFDSDTEKTINLEHSEQASQQITIGNCITSLRLVNTLDWEELFEKISMVETILKSDPANIYQNQDFESRDYYRHRIEMLSKKLNISETKIARKAVFCSKQALDDGSKLAQTHIGYYIVGEGESLLISLLTNKPQKAKSKKFSSSKYIATMLITSIITTVLFINYTFPTLVNPNIFFVLFIGFIFWISFSEIIINASNKIITKITPPAFLPKLEFNNVIPEENTTIIIVPTLIPNINRALELINSLEVTYLANNETNIYFAILGDFKDCVSKSIPEDEKIIQCALNKTKELNQKYSNDEDIFFFFMRERSFIKEDNKWMGYERKRGAIAEFNDLIKGCSNTTYKIMSNSIDCLNKVKYVITLDADTIMPIDIAKKLIGTIAHPINKATYDNVTGVVTNGYGLIQPRIGLNIKSSNKSIFSRIFAGEGGVDSYTNAISDVYQDLFGEGIFTGKGIYDIDIYRMALTNSIPDNTILSHDLLEGSYLRVGLVTDIELIDNYPEKYNSYIMRLHRWTRGDWQLIKWLFPRIKNKSGEKIKNPLCSLSKWKIFDNLRRSLVSTSLMLIFLMSILFVPEKVFFWAGFAFLTIFLPLITSFFEYIKSTNYYRARQKLNGNLIYGIKSIFYETLLVLVFLPYNSYMMINAIAKTLYRVFVSHKNMLEWVTAADVEKNIKNDLYSYIKRMFPVLAILYSLFIITLIFSNSKLIFPLIMVIIWSFSPFLAYHISKITKESQIMLDYETNVILRRICRKTWNFYETFAGFDDNFLPPDNYQLTPVKRIAHRTSPTNIGLLLISILGAKDLGYITLSSMLKRIKATLASIEKMEKWNGHLYNWYDTKTLKLLRPKYISTVDSGNFISYLITLREGMREVNHEPLINKNLVTGLYDTLALYDKDNSNILSVIKEFQEKNNFRIKGFYDFLRDVLKSYNSEETSVDKRAICYREISLLINEVERFFPYVTLDKSYQELISKSTLGKFFNSAIGGIEENPTIPTILATYNNIIIKIEEILKKEKRNPKFIEPFKAVKQIFVTAYSEVMLLSDEIGITLNKLSALIDCTSFTKLFDTKIGLFSIGYNIEENKLTNSYYDLLASEARIASYIAVARREVPVSHWFKLGRSLSLIDGYKGLVSWTGTMFEYFMPPLVMKVYGNTLLDETYKTVLKAQIKYGNCRNVPWGTSESGFYTFDLMLNYQYKAFGVPELGLKRGLINDMVVSPYSTILGLPFSSIDCDKNINSLISHGLEGEFGFYEAIDFTPERLTNNNTKAIVESFMAHHQGMIIIALTNYFKHNIMVDRFHSCPMIKSGEFLLQERIPMRVLITKEHKEIIAPLEKIEYSIPTIIRRFRNLDTYLPECHILSNGNYSLLINSKGSGYSRREDTYLTRWREEIPSRNFGFFIFFKDINSNYIWSSTFDPFNHIPEKYEARFSQDKVEFFRKDFDIDTHTELCVSPEDNCEIRRITITNNGANSAIIECTSYLETVIANNMSDVAHPTFNNLFIRTEAVLEYNTLISSRRPREESGKPMFTFHTINTLGDNLGDFEYESDRYKFIGRGNDITKATALNHPLSNSVGAVLDPIMSLRRKIKIDPGKSETISFIIGISDSKVGCIELAKKYNEYSNILRAFELAYIRSQMSCKYLNLKNSEMECYDNMISNIVYLSPLRKKYEKYIIQNKKGQMCLWSHGISGDIPIVLVTIKDTEDIEIVRSMVKAHEYLRTKGLRIDLIILNEDESSYLQPLQNLIKDIVLTSNAREILDVIGGIFIKNSRLIQEEDKTLFYSVARIIIKGELGSIKAQMRYSNEQSDIPIKKYLENEIVNYNSVDEPLTLQYFNEYGGFNANNNEYIIRLRTNMNTPAPWSNVIANKNFGFLVTESGSGYTWSQNSRENKLTVWTNDPICDTPSEIIYLRNDLNGSIWSITPLPIREKENYTIIHGMGYTTFNHYSNGIEQSLTQFVPSNDDCIKISKVNLINRTPMPQELSIYYYIKPVLGVSDQVTQPYITSQYLEDTDTLLFRNPYNPDFSDRITFVDSSLKKFSITSDRKEFIGGSGSLEFPEGLLKEALSGKLGGGFYPCGAIQCKIKLMPQEKLEFVMLLGEGNSNSEIVSLCSKYKDIHQCDIEFENVKTFWENVLGTVQVKTPDSTMDLMLNSWLIYQTLACRIWARSAFYQSGGAFGFRDQLQDILSIINIIPEIAKNQILLHCEHQFLEGDVQHWWHPGTNNKGIRTKFSDDLLWLPFAVSEYVEKTGDSSILSQIAPFLEDSPLKENEDERYSIPQTSEEAASVYEHCMRSIERAIRFGEHGLPLMGSGDWNDGMNTVGNKGKGESVWMGWFLCYVLSKFSIICKTMDDLTSYEKYTKLTTKISSYIEENAWDGQWYRRAYFDDGTPLGSSINKECKIDSLAQSWSVISGYGNKERTETAMQSLENYLIIRDAGLILLFTPPFDDGDLKPGYIKGYVPGVRENGGQYTHAATWVVSAFAKMGQGNKALEYYKLINPITHSMTQMECARYKVEPYVMAADVYAVDPHKGRGGWTWYTGSSGWMHKVGLEDILGFKKCGDTLMIDPCIPDSWAQYSLVYKYNGTTYKINVNNPNNHNRGVVSVTVNGIDIPDKKIILKDYGVECNIEVILG